MNSSKKKKIIELGMNAILQGELMIAARRSFDTVIRQKLENSKKEECDKSERSMKEKKKIAATIIAYLVYRLYLLHQCYYHQITPSTSLPEISLLSPYSSLPS